MNNVVRAWKDEAYRQSRSTEEQAMLPTNPAGEIELTDTELEAISGAYDHGKDLDKIRQAADQVAFATFGNYTVIVDSIVWCDPTNRAHADATIGDE
jgi:mersacidin/lichenicidin family type 2 lantibiotic